MASSGRLAVGVEEGEHGVGRIRGEAVLALVPLFDELLRAQMPHDPLRAVGEVERRRRQTVQGQAVAVDRHAAGHLHEHGLDLFECLLDVVTHGHSSSAAPMTPAGQGSQRGFTAHHTRCSAPSCL